ncbi:MAG: CoA transferase [Dehalococcoidales bacterium]|nr:CoA transferase [Dehalococcoidales bacterium]
MNKNVFQGIKILDFSRNLAGPLTTKTLADYGAQVIKLESNASPDPLRGGEPFKDKIVDYNRAGRFIWANTSKLSVSINLTKPEGIALAKKLATWADVVIENFAGGAIQRMGLGYEVLKQVKPDIIMLSSCMQGQTGPHATHPGFGMQLSALSGFNYITGWPDRDPVEVGTYTDFIASDFNLLILLAAILYRRRTGRGMYLDMSQYENVVHFMAPILLDANVNQRIAKKVGNRIPNAAPHGAYRCYGSDRWCVIAVYKDEEWTKFCTLIGNPLWTKDRKFDTFLARKQNEDELDRLIEVWTMARAPEEVMSLLQDGGVAACLLEDTQDVMDRDPHLKDRNFHWELDHPVVGKYRAQRPHFVLSKVPCQLRSAPLLGEHNWYVLKDILGMSDEEIAGLINSGIME